MAGKRGEYIYDEMGNIIGATGGLKTKLTIEKKYGKDFFVKIGRRGGKNGSTGGFGSRKIGADGLTGVERAKIAGVKGGKISKRGKSKKNVVV